MSQTSSTSARTLDLQTLPLYGRALIEASAGTGKTYTIANLVLRLLLEERKPVAGVNAPEAARLSIDQILIVTFTNAATEELRGRVRLRIKQAHTFLQRYQVVSQVYQDSDYKNDLEKEALTDHEQEFAFCCEAIAETDALILSLLKPYTASVTELQKAKTALKDALLQMDEAAIFTIHGFCQRVLQQHAFESGSYFDLNLVQDPSEELLEVATTIWREQCYGQSLAVSYYLQTQFKEPSVLLQKIRPLIGKSQHIIPAVTGPVGQKDWLLLADKIEQNYRKAQSIWLNQATELQALLLEHEGLNRNQYRLTSLPKRFTEIGLYLSDEQYAYDVPDSFVYFTQEKILGASKKNPLEHVFFDYCQSIQDDLAEFRLCLIQQMVQEFEQRFITLKEERRQLGFDDLLTYLDQALSQDDSGEFATALGQQYPVAMIDEFQDTDPTQYAIFDRVYRNPDLTLFMIGDPKQAIYSFRGADIHTYLKAKQQVGEACYTLDVNYRSVGAVVNSVNHLFLQSSQPFGQDTLIDYPKVSANQESDPGLLLSNEAKSGISFGYFQADEGDQTEGYNELDVDKKSGLIIKDSAARFAAKACATEIVQLLHEGSQGKACLGNKAVSSEDIAILVRDRNEAALIQRELKQRQVGSVFISRERVFDTLEAMQLRMILSACFNPSSGALLRGVLGSALFGYTADQLAEIAENGAKWEQHVLRFNGYKQTWQKSGFMAMWSLMLQDYHLAEKVIAQDDGERKITNLLQLAELLQKATQHTHGEQGLLAWFDEQFEQEQQEIEEQQLRLESDSTLVQITTIHKSKGLEYPIVFLPFAFRARQAKTPEFVTFYDKKRERYTIDIGSKDKKNHYEQAKQDQLSEDLRLYYVALTRPRYLCRIYWGLVKDVQNTALYHLFYPDVDIKTQDAKQFKDRLRAVVQSAGECDIELSLDDSQAVPLMSLYDLQVNNLAYHPELSEGFDALSIQSNAQELTAKSLTQTIDRSWRMTSYSGLIHKAHSALEKPDYDEEAAKDSTQSDQQGEEDAMESIFTFERGRQAGNFMHKVFELATFDDLANKSSDELIADKLISFGFESEPWQQVISDHFQSVVLSELGKPSGLALHKLSAQQCLDELEFYLPMAHISTPALNRVFNAYRQSIAAKAPDVTLQFNDMQGMLKGFIDLVFEYQGQFFVADYKSNHLGNNASDYHNCAMQAQMFDHKYDIQLLIYTLALHRYLQSRLPDYHYETHIGGAYYLFIRGMSSEDSHEPYGIYYHKPDLDHVLALESALLLSTQTVPNTCVAGEGS